MPEAGTKPCAGRRTAYQQIARRLREVATEIRNAPLRGPRAEREILSAQDALRALDRDLGRSLDGVRIELSEQRRDAAVAEKEEERLSFLRRAPAVADGERVVAWLAGYQHRRSQSRFGIVERGGPDDREAQRVGAVAEIVGKGHADSMLLGGELGVRLLRSWPQAKTGALKRLGPVGVARLVAGGKGEERIRAVAEARERKDAEASQRRFILEGRAEAALGRDPARAWLSPDRKERARTSAAGLGEVIAELEGDGDAPDMVDLAARMRILDELFATASLSRHHHESQYRAACHAALDSGTALAGLLDHWNQGHSWIRFGPGALAKALRRVSATAALPPEKARTPAAEVERR